MDETMLNIIKYEKYLFIPAERVMEWKRYEDIKNEILIYHKLWFGRQEWKICIQQWLKMQFL